MQGAFLTKLLLSKYSALIGILRRKFFDPIPIEINILITPNLVLHLSLRDFAIPLPHFIGMGFFALSRTQPVAPADCRAQQNDGFTW